LNGVTLGAKGAAGTGGPGGDAVEADVPADRVGKPGKLGADGVAKAVMSAP
jgi:hypothetical protein